MESNKNIKYIIYIIIVIILIIIVFGLLWLINKKNNKPVIINNTSNVMEEEPKEEENEEDKITQLFNSEEYYIADNLERYLKYLALNPSKSYSTVVGDVNANVDYEFYTFVKESNLDDGILMIVNKYHSLSKDYVPDLVTMEDGYTKVSGKMNKEAYEHYKMMVDDAKLEDIILYNVSAYRSYNTQSILYNDYVKRDGTIAADRYSARPGYSEHQTGLASDINTASSKDHFENTKEYAWLIANSYKYGFILRYPEEKEYLTGYKFEPWHYRYVGVDAATYIHEHDITYDEYYAYFIENN